MLKILFIIVIFIEIYFLNCYIVLPINNLTKNFYKSQNASDSFSEIMSREFFTPLNTSLKIGTPPQSIYLLIKPRKNYFIFNSIKDLVNKTLNNESQKLYDFTKFPIFYNENKSSTYNETENCFLLKKTDNNLNPIAEQICPSHDTLYFFENLNNMTNASEKKEIEFSLTRNTFDNITGIIGLNLLDKNEPKIASFLSILKKNKIINNYYWYFDFDNWNNTNGNLIIGKLPHEIDNSNYTKKELKYAKKEDSSENYYEMKFNQIYFIKNESDPNSEKIFFDNKNITFNFESNVIVGTEECKDYLWLILRDLIINKKCFISNFFGYEDEFLNKGSFYDFFYCNNTNETKDELNENISSLYFKSSEMDYTFEITKEQIIREIGDYIFINIVFNQDNNKNKNKNRWILGKPFIFKYKLVYDSNTGKFGFYKKENNDKIYKLLIIIPLIIYICIGPIIIAVKHFRKDDKEPIEEKNNEDEENNLKQNIIN